MTSVLLLRHGATASHRGDIPLTADGRRQAELAGQELGHRPLGRCSVITSPLIRARQTGLLLAHGVCRTEPEATIGGPSTSWGLRNPDLYLAGERVEMVSSAEDFSSQVQGTCETEVRRVPFFADFLSAPDRIGHWLHHDAPPGEDGAQVARRMSAFVASLCDGILDVETVVCVTHSPVLRAVAVDLLGEDPGEPEYLTGLSLEVAASGRIISAATTSAW